MHGVAFMIWLRSSGACISDHVNFCLHSLGQGKILLERELLQGFDCDGMGEPLIGGVESVLNAVSFVLEEVVVHEAC